MARGDAHTQKNIIGEEEPNMYLGHSDAGIIVLRRQSWQSLINALGRLPVTVLCQAPGTSGRQTEVPWSQDTCGEVSKIVEELRQQNLPEIILGISS